MVATEERRRSFLALKCGAAAEEIFTLSDSQHTNFEPVDLVLLDISGWRGLALTMGWDQVYLRSFDDLVARWLVGRDRRELLQIATEQTSAAHDGLDFGKLAVSWLNEERLGRLESLINESQYEVPIYPVCYSLGKAFTAVDIAIEHMGASYRSTEELSLVPADNGCSLEACDVS